MSYYFNDTSSVIVFFMGIFVAAIFIIGVWEFTRQSITGEEVTLSVKIKKKDSVQADIK